MYVLQCDHLFNWMMIMSDKPVVRLNPKQEAFARAVVLNGGDKVKARVDAGYSTNMTSNSQGIDADKLFNHAKISLRIAQLQEQADKTAKECFTITVEQRLRWLKEIAEAGLSTYEDGAGAERRENLSAAKSSIDTMNNMLGVSDKETEDSRSLNINFNVSAPVGDIEVTKGS